MKFCFLFCLFFGVSLYAQETPGFQIPNYAAKTPEAAAFLKYGEYPVNLSTGVPNISIPLYTIQLKDFQMPIALNYHASGIKVNQEATWVGLGWNLNFGAQIILNVQEEVDENNNMAYEMPNINSLNQYYQNNPYQFSGGQISSQQLEKSRIRDVYQFSSPTASGTFYFEDETTIVVFPPDAFKVEKGPAQGVNFMITDAAGNKYLFHHWEQYNAIERSYRTETHHDSYNSAWYVTKIETANKEVINFIYEDDGDLSEYSTTHKHEVFWNTVKCGCPPNGGTETKGVGPLEQPGGSTITASKKIREINFNNGASRILFDRESARADLPTGLGNSQSRLNIIKIQQKDHNGEFQYVRGFDFEYDYFSSGNNYWEKRLKLTHVMDLLTGDAHSFIYSDIEMPSKKSFAQDMFGYYNGANTNYELVPKYKITTPVNTIVGSADRKVKNTKHQAGVLREIHYPTKGYTKFNYEPNQYYGVFNNEAFENGTTLIGAAQGVGPGGNPIGNMDNQPTPGEEGDQYVSQCQDPATCVRYYTLHFYAGPGTIASINPVLQNSDQSTVYNHMYGRVRIISGSDTLYDSGPNRYLSWSETVDNIGLSGSVYVVIEAWGEDIRMSAGITYYDPSPKNIDMGGLRIASIENYDFDNTLLTKKIYDYSDPNYLPSPGLPSRSSGRIPNDLGLNFNFNFTTPMFSQWTNIGPCGSGELIDPPSLDYRKSYWVTSRTRFGMEANPITYEYVKESAVDAQGNINGYTLYKFNTDNDWYESPEVFMVKSWKRGELLEKSDYMVLYGYVHKLLRKEVNTYADDNAKISYVEGFKMLRTGSVDIDVTGTVPPLLPFGFCSIPYNVMETVDFRSFNHPVRWHYLKKKDVTENFYNSTGALLSTLTTYTEYTYSNPVHMQISKQVTTSSQNETIEARYYYPGDGAVQNEPQVTNLLAQNMISIPLKTQAYVNGEKISEQKTLYKSWPSYTTGEPHILPEIIQAAKGSDALENRIITVSRDLAGNPTEVKLENGVSVSYVWGYSDAHPIAKIENVSYSSISSTLIDEIKDISTNGTEEQLIDKLTELRIQMPDKMITTYTYKPLIGLSTVIDPRGYKTTYHFDNMGRLRFVKDAEGKILTENFYNYKN